MTPRTAIAAYAATDGHDRVVDGCLALLAGADLREDAELARVLAGGAAEWMMSGGEGEYWPRVWALRGLRWCWDDRATGGVLGALGDHHWRVREMAAKVAGAHGVEAALPALTGLHDDPNRRVAAAARRAELALVR